MRRHTESGRILDITTAEGARTYIKDAADRIQKALGKTVTFVTTSLGRKLELAKLSDEEAVDVAHMLLDSELKAKEMLANGEVLQ